MRCFAALGCAAGGLGARGREGDRWQVMGDRGFTATAGREGDRWEVMGDRALLLLRVELTRRARRARRWVGLRCDLDGRGCDCLTCRQGTASKE